jgi:hypothetical protein
MNLGEDCPRSDSRFRDRNAVTSPHRYILEFLPLPRLPVRYPPSVPESYTISYSDRLHEETRRDLSRLSADLDRWLEDYENGIPFPHRKDCQTNCPYGKSIDLAEGNSLEAINEINPFID